MSIVPLARGEACSADNSPGPVVLHVVLPVPEWFLCLSLPCSELQKTSLLRLHHSATPIFWFSVGFGQWQAVEGNQRVGGRRYQAIYFPILVLCPMALFCFDAYVFWLSSHLNVSKPFIPSLALSSHRDFLLLQVPGHLTNSSCSFNPLLTSR